MNSSHLSTQALIGFLYQVPIGCSQSYQLGIERQKSAFLWLHGADHLAAKDIRTLRWKHMSEGWKKGFRKLSVEDAALNSF